jgi:hypothetical protein
MVGFLPAPRRPATAAQLGYIHSLYAQKKVPVAGHTLDEATTLERLDDALGGKPVDSREASQVIDYLKAAPYRHPRPSAAHRRS